MIRVLAVALPLLLVSCMSDHPQHKARGNVLFHNGDIDGAIKEYRAAVAADPKDPGGHTLLGNALFEKSQYADAEKSYRDALARDASARDARRGLAAVMLRTGRSAEARTQFEALVQQSADDYEAHAALGKLLRATGDLDGAERHLRHATTIVKNDAATLYALGLTLAEKKSETQALEVFDRLEQVAPGKALAPYGRAVTYARGGKKDEALTWLGRALERMERGVDKLDDVEKDPGLASLKDDPRFASLLAEARRRGPPSQKKGAP